MPGPHGGKYQTGSYKTQRGEPGEFCNRTCISESTVRTIWKKKDEILCGLIGKKKKAVRWIERSRRKVSCLNNVLDYLE